MKRVTVYLVLATLAAALFATSPAAARACHRYYSGYYRTTYPYRWSAPYRYSAWRNYGTWNNWSYPYNYAAWPYNYTGWNYPYNYTAWNYPYYGWGAAATGLVAAPFEVAGATVAAPFEVAANATAPIVTGRSVAVGPYYVRHTYWTRHARYIRPGIMTGRSVAVIHHVRHGRSAYVCKRR
jgi:hypothetical protein